MIIACPACATRYVVPDSAIGADGRTVRCAKCRHSWFQDGPVLADPLPTAAVAPAEPPRQQPDPPPAAPSEPVGNDEPAAAPAPSHIGPSYDERDEQALLAPTGFEDPRNSHDEDPSAPTVIEASPTNYSEPEAYPDEVSQFDYEPPFRPRRNMVKVWTWAAAVFAVLALGTVGAVTYWGLPDWVPISRPTFALGQPDLVLDFPRDQQERRTLPNGTEYFGASGTVKNVGRETRAIPSILIVLRDGRERIVYSWEIAPPKASLAPGETVTINEAVTDVPRSAKIAEIGWKPV
jgi:predicted Zn finger-like uncharacterized protein